MVDRNTKIRGTQVHENTIPPSKLKAINSPVNGYLLRYDNGAGEFEWVSSSNATTETPSGTVNGSNKVFTASQTPLAGSLSVYLNGLYQEEGSGNDYVVSGSTITFVDAPETGDNIVITYITGVGAAGGNGDMEKTTYDADNDGIVDNSEALNDNGTPVPSGTIIKTSAGVVADGGGSVISTGLVASITIPFDCTIIEARLLADQSGDIVVDVRKSTFSSFPTTSSIAGASKPTLSSSQKLSDTTLSGWTTSLDEGDVVEFNVDSVNTITKCAIQLVVKKR